MTAPLPPGSPVTPDAIYDFAIDVDANSDFDTTLDNSFTATPNVDNTVISKSFTFKDGYAYEVRWYFPWRINGGTGPLAACSKLKRSSSTGSTIHDPGFVSMVEGVVMSCNESTIVKVTNGDTTQTLVVTAAFSSIGSAGDLDVPASGLRRRRIDVKRCGLASDYPNALELPTV